MTELLAHIDSMERVICLEAAIIGSEEALKKVIAELAEVTGWKHTLARQKLKAAEEVLAAQKTEIAERMGPLSMDTFVYFIRAAANYRVERTVLSSSVEEKEAALAAAIDAGKTGAWKWQGRKDAPEAPAIVAARTALKKAKDALAALEERSAAINTMVEEEVAYRKESREIREWIAEGCPDDAVPLKVQREREEWKKEMLAGCVVLRRPLPSDRKVFLPPVEEDESWMGRNAVWEDPLTVEQYIMSLGNNFAPPRPVQQKEEYVYRPASKKKTWLDDFKAKHKMLSLEKQKQ